MTVPLPPLQSIDLNKQALDSMSTCIYTLISHHTYIHDKYSAHRSITRTHIYSHCVSPIHAGISYFIVHRTSLNKLNCTQSIHCKILQILSNMSVWMSVCACVQVCTDIHSIVFTTLANRWTLNSISFNRAF